jgi:hypothetical protein
MTPETIRLIAERLLKANANRDYALARHIVRPYPFGSPERRAIDAAVNEICRERQAACKPEYFR